MIFNNKPIPTAQIMVQQRSDEERMLWLQMGLDLENRSFSLRGIVDDTMAEFALRCLTRLTAENHDPITIYLNSPGGSVTDGFAVYDLIEACPCIVTIIALGQVCSMAPIIMLAADRRIALARTHFMLHAPMFAQDRETDVDRHMDDAKDGMQSKARMVKVLAERTKKNADFWNKKITKQDYNFSLKEAREYGIVNVSPTVTKKSKRKK